MKNVHVLPTNQPSRLFITDNKLFNYHKPQQGDGVKIINQNICITNSEEIKEGDWCVITDIESVLYGQFEKHKGKHLRNDQWKKIILTTDQDLIKDGVQAIDDEFLEWFVNNPSCEEVRVEKTAPIRPFGSLYKIIIPKEEKDYTALLQQVGTKQETLEEAVERLYPINIVSDGHDTNFLGRVGLYLGAKWQQDNSNENALEFEIAALKSLIQNMDATIKSKYNEEEVRKLLQSQRGNCYVAILTKTRDIELASLATLAPEPGGKDGWIKQSKKK